MVEYRSPKPSVEGSSPSSPANFGECMNFLKFIDEVKQEMVLVSWTSKKETIYTTIFVMVIVSIFTVYFLLADSCIYYVVKKLLIK